MPAVPRATAKPQRKALGPTSMSSSLGIAVPMQGACIVRSGCWSFFSLLPGRRPVCRAGLSAPLLHPLSFHI